MNYRIDRTLTYFSKETDELVGELPLVGIDLAALQRIFHVEPDDPMYESYIVSPEHVPAIQPHVSETIDLDRYDYFIEATGTPTREGGDAKELVAQGTDRV
jgi:hypothetical protein